MMADLETFYHTAYMSVEEVPEYLCQTMQKHSGHSDCHVLTLVSFKLGLVHLKLLYLVQPGTVATLQGCSILHVEQLKSSIRSYWVSINVKGWRYTLLHWIGT